jgi:hypothetical protein
VNSVAQVLISIVVGGVVAVLATFGLVTSQTGTPDPVSTDVVTYDN